MPTSQEIAQQQARNLVDFKDSIAAGRANNVKLQRFVVTELGPSPVKVTLQGGCMPLVGPEYPSDLRGGVYVPLGSDTGIAAVTGLLFGETEFTFRWQIPFFSPDDFTVDGLDSPTGPEDLAKVFQQIQKRGRACEVSVGAFGRIGVLRRVNPKPGRGYLVDAFGALTAPGTNVECTLKWEWTGVGLPAVPDSTTVSVEDVRKQIVAGVAAMASALSDTDPFEPDFLSSLKNALGNIRAGVSGLQRSLAAIGSFVNAPANLANDALATARSVGNLCRQFDDLISDTAAQYRSVGTNAAALLRSARAVHDARGANTDITTAVVDMIAALEKRKPRIVGVSPGQLLSDVAQAQLGNADRWTEIAQANGIDGQFVPQGTYSVTLPGGS